MHCTFADLGSNKVSSSSSSSSMNSANMYSGGDGGVCVCSRMRVRAYVGMRACVMCLQYTIIKFDPG